MTAQAPTHEPANGQRTLVLLKPDTVDWFNAERFSSADVRLAQTRDQTKGRGAIHASLLTRPRAREARGGC